MVFMEMLKNKYNYFRSYQLYHYRESNNNEVDLILDFSTHLDAFEIKSEKTFDKSFLIGLNHISGIFPLKVRNTTVCYSGDMEQTIGNNKLVNFKNIVSTIS
jgi:hypothetical protein